MTQAAPAFWVKFRGVVDPQRPFNTTYSYTAYLFLAGQYQRNGFTGTGSFAAITFLVTGPPQLSKRNFMELRWNFIPALTTVLITRGGVPYYVSNGAEQGFRDEDQFLTINGGVTNQ